MSNETPGGGSSGKGRPGGSRAAVVKRACENDVVISNRFDLSAWEYLGQGACGVVAKVRDLLRDDVVAVKFMLVEGDEDPRRRLPSEIKNPSWNSKYHTKVFGPGQSTLGDILFIEMEYVGHSLKEELARRKHEGRPFTIAEAIAIAHDAACGVRDAHLTGVVHRDVKPGNYLMDPTRDPWVKLADFGISKMRDMGLTGSGEFPGTPEYAAPEVSFADATRAADIWSLGETIYRIFTDELPFVYPPKANVISIIDCKRTQKPRSAISLRNDVPREISDLLLRMLAKEPGLRPSAEEVVDALAAAREGTARILTNSSGGAAEAPALPRWQLALAAGIAVAVIIGAMIFSRTPSEASKVQPIAKSSVPAARLETNPVPAGGSSAAVAPHGSGALARIRVKGEDIWFENISGKAFPAETAITITDKKGTEHVLHLEVTAPGASVWLARDDFIPTLTVADGISVSAGLVLPGSAPAIVEIQAAH